MATLKYVTGLAAENYYDFNFVVYDASETLGEWEHQIAAFMDKDEMLRCYPEAQPE